MNVEMITKQDLQHLKTEIIAELQSILSQQKPSEATWLRSAQVRKMLSISAGTLQNLRIQGHLRFTKIGGCFFYNQRDIAAMLNQNGVKR
ncbi:helix-turn-helix domain-containing protein [Dyadobacter pollutisoli]|uniref:Helix-turn-helix domain-containing protein n=1 Tax=Dyadobacter pollutisoli TaxID=2910158 RepID=A0A9E8NDR4_9BACT|nr:helix-turn-helix domain-containing protein [Dyadobacter pollutisoli]WAC12432.1 helix-turn-helix domain-containing protein [Dyadobacter pollutisoli]